MCFEKPVLTLLHSEWPKLHRVLAFLSAVGLRRIGTVSNEEALLLSFLARLYHSTGSYCCHFKVGVGVVLGITLPQHVFIL